MKVEDSHLWHEIFAEVLRRYAGKTLPREVVLRLPDGPSGDTLLVHHRQSGLHVSLVSLDEAESYRQMGLSGWLR